MANNLSIAAERRKLQLKASILNGRVTIAAKQQEIKKARAELKSYSTKRSNSNSGSSITPLRIGGR